MLPARLPSHLALSLALGLLAACTTNNKPVEPPRKSTNGQDAANKQGSDQADENGASPARGGDPGETASPDQIADSGLADDKFKEGRIFVNGWDGKADQPEGRKKWTLANLTSVPVPATAGNGSGSATGSASTASTPSSTTTTASNTGAGTDSATNASPSTETPASATPAANDQGN